MKFNELLKLTKETAGLKNKNAAHLAINLNKVTSKNIVHGLRIDTKETKNGIRIKMFVAENADIKERVYLCFGITHKKASQKIKMSILVHKNAKISIFAHCFFPNATDIKHLMDAEIKIEEGASYTYEEKHFHGASGGTKVFLKANVRLEKKSRFKNSFELTKGSAGKLEIDYAVTSKQESVAEITSKISGSGNDIIKIKEVNNLVGKKAKGALISKIAVRGNAKAEVYNIMEATAPDARGHIDCKEIIQDNGKAVAIPIVKVMHSQARITHEAAIGSVDTKQLETLLARGLNENEAMELIIAGLMN